MTSSAAPGVLTGPALPFGSVAGAGGVAIATVVGGSVGAVVVGGTVTGTVVTGTVVGAAVVGVVVGATVLIAGAVVRGVLVAVEAA